MNSPKRSIWLHPERVSCVQIVDQRALPHQVVIADITSSDEAAQAIQEMWVRGAPLIGAMAAFGYSLAALEAVEQGEDYFQKQIAKLAASRPTAVNLQWALDRQEKVSSGASSFGERSQRALKGAKEIVELEVQISEAIGEHGLALIREKYQQKQETINILTHCNAGRMATIEWGTATAPIYKAHQAGIPVHIWVDETRPRNQGARITAWDTGFA
ncbi:MAG: S-methyl-5-thioribose-1-phosphate isomerase, partial [Bacteroidota bacterium]